MRRLILPALIATASPALGQEAGQAEVQGQAQAQVGVPSAGAQPSETVPSETGSSEAASPEAVSPEVALPEPVEAEPVITPAQEAAFRTWIAGFRDRALAAGITPATWDMAMADVALLPEIVAKDRDQAEFTRTLWDYLDRAVSDRRIENGRAALALHADLLDRIEARYGVEKQVVVAVWGMESGYGAFKGDVPVLSALATLAHDGRRAALFEAQLIAALKIVQTGEIAPADLRGSWAGAMGHTQFMPTSWLETAVDFTGDGRRDIWGEDPADALASTAAYLARAGWTRGQPWAVEVVLPAGYDYAQSGKRLKKPLAEWQALGLTTAEGRWPERNGETAALLLPAGARGPALLIFGNFAAIERYNAADSYVIAVGHLSDRLSGGGAFRTDWPRGDRALLRAERVELQERLTAAGFDTAGADGILGPKSQAALRAFQQARGLPADGYASEAMLLQLRDLTEEGAAERAESHANGAAPGEGTAETPTLVAPDGGQPDAAPIKRQPFTGTVPTDQ